MSKRECSRQTGRPIPDYKQEYCMSNFQEQNRVLGRAGARLLSESELKQITGGFHTNVCSFNPTTCVVDGDCLLPPACGN